MQAAIPVVLDGLSNVCYVMQAGLRVVLAGRWTHDGHRPPIEIHPRKLPHFQISDYSSHRLAVRDYYIFR